MYLILHWLYIGEGSMSVIYDIKTVDLDLYSEQIYTPPPTHTHTEGPQFTEEPADTSINVGESLTLPCKVSFDSTSSDIVYMWYFNDHLIRLGLDYSDSAHYR